MSSSTAAAPVAAQPTAAQPQDAEALRHTTREDAQAMLTATLIMSFGVLMFSHAGLLTGGTAGVAFLIHYLTGWGFGAVMFVVNVPFYWLAWQRMGRDFTIKTVLSVGMLSVIVTFMPRLVSFDTLSPIFAAVIGGLLMGVSILILFRHRASLGGFNVLALYLQDHFGWRAGRVLMVLDGTILICSFGVVDWQHVAISVLAAVLMNQTLVTNHRKERYIAL